MTMLEAKNNERCLKKTDALFQRAKQYLKPSELFHFVSYLYAERKMLVFVAVHFVCTISVWVHFGMEKYEILKETISEDEPYYRVQRAVPPIVYGSKHAMLLQMAAIPLTMSRMSIAALSDSALAVYVPLKRAVRLHILYAYTMIFLMVVALVGLYVFYLSMCAVGVQDYCDRLSSEIMMTGYAISLGTIIVGATAYFRHEIPYELFYVVHHLVFILYGLTILHTLDTQYRHGRQRSQTFTWVSATLLYYVCDRVGARLNHKYRVRAVSCSTVSGGKSKMVVLRLSRPTLFEFKPGQYVYLKVPEIGDEWHPFSVASGSADPFIDFYVEVFDDQSWTHKLWKILKHVEEPEDVIVDMMGPYGTSIANTDNYSHALLIGTGTGIVPMLSLFNQHIQQLLRLEPESHFVAMQQQQAKVDRIEKAVQNRKRPIAAKVARSTCCVSPQKDQHKSKSESLKASIQTGLSQLEQFSDNGSRSSFFDKRDSLRMPGPIRQSQSAMKRAAFQATRSIYGVVMLCMFTVLGVLLLAATISLCGNKISEGTFIFVGTCTIAFQACYASVALFVWEGSSVLAVLDMLLILIVPLADWYFYCQYRADGEITHKVLLQCSILLGYVLARTWCQSVRPRHMSWKTRVHADGIAPLDGLELVWISRSAALVSELLPIISNNYQKLVTAWGEENAHAVCAISIYVTDKDQGEIEALKDSLDESPHFRSDSIKFQRPDLPDIIERHTHNVICTRKYSHSVLAFCGSPSLATKLHQAKIHNDMLTSITGNKRHQMEFVCEAYGGENKRGAAGTDKKSKSTEALSAAEPMMEASLYSHSSDGSTLGDSFASSDCSSYGENDRGGNAEAPPAGDTVPKPRHRTKQPSRKPCSPPLPAIDERKSHQVDPNRRLTPRKECKSNNNRRQSAVE